VAHARAAADADDHLDLAARAGELVGDGDDDVLAAIEHRLTADADEDHVGQHFELALGVRARDDAAVDERLAHQVRLDVRSAVALQ
jgi:hypothetical protein